MFFLKTHKNMKFRKFLIKIIKKIKRSPINFEFVFGYENLISYLYQNCAEKPMHLIFEN